MKAEALPSCLPRTAYPDHEHGVHIPDSYDEAEASVREWVPDIDEGVVLHVTLLRHAGVQTIYSCEGGPGHSAAFPYVEFEGDPAEGLRALSVALRANLPVSSLARYWRIRSGEIIGPVWRMEFHATHKEPVPASRLATEPPS